MNTEHTLLIEKTNINLKKLKIPPLTEDEKTLFKFYVEITRHIQEIDQLFHIFRVNLNNLLYFYELNSSDIITRKNAFDFQENDLIIINAFTINYISSAKTLTDSIETFLRENTTQTPDIYKSFKKNNLSKIYDSNFSYRFLIRIRDFSQHGHLPVNVGFNNKYCFNLEEILSTPHFHHNEKIEKELKKLKDEIYNKYNDYPQLVYTLSIAEFNFSVITIYNDFLNIVEPILKKSIQDINSLLERKPNIIHKSKDALNGYVLYDCIDKKVHCFNPKDDSLKMLYDYKSTVSNILSEEEKELAKLKKCYKFK